LAPEGEFDHALIYRAADKKNFSEVIVLTSSNAGLMKRGELLL